MAEDQWTSANLINQFFKVGMQESNPGPPGWKAEAFAAANLANEGWIQSAYTHPEK